jgi:hypothetical protein
MTVVGGTAVWGWNGELIGGHGGAGPEVVHIALAGEATGDKQQVVAQVGGHAHGHAAGGGVDEQLGGAALDVAAEDVAGEQVTGVEGGPAAGGDALGRAGPGQDDDLGRSGRGGRPSQRDH